MGYKKSGFKMKGYDYPGKSPMEQKDIDLSKMSEKEIGDVVKRNVDVVTKKGDDYMKDTPDIDKETKMEIYDHYRNNSGLATDSLDASLAELRKRYKSGELE